MRRIIFGLWAMLLALPAAAQPASPPVASATPAPEFRARADALVTLLAGKGDYDAYFAPVFREKVPKAQFDAIGGQLVTAYGAPVAAESYQMAGPHQGRFTLRFPDASATVRMTVESSPPHQVTGLLFEGVTAQERTLEDVAAALRGLHGETGFVLARLGEGGPKTLLAHHPDKPLAVGSAFKLLIFAELVRATNVGERHWDDRVTLDGSELPGGGYMLKPKGTQVSLRELATQMISISDNSATDALLKELGREKIEAMLPVVGIADPARNRPFLSTLEAFKLKGIQANALAERYLAQDEAGRRKMLAGEVARTPMLMISPTLFRDGKPVQIEEIEWFFSPADLVRLMDWLRRNTEGPQGGDARAILSKNPGIAPATAAKWQWVGFKGGSEPGVINMTLLLQAKTGDWHVLAGSWNDPAQPVSEARFAALIGRYAELAVP